MAQPTAQAISENHGILASIRDALRGDTHRDFTAERIGRAITLLAIPMVLEMTMESLFAVVDMFWVAHVGADAVATIGLTEAVLTLVFSVAMGLGVATGAMVARRIGEKDPEAACQSGAQAILLGLAVAAVCGTAGVWFASDVLRLMGASPSIIATGSSYTRVIYGGSAAVMLLFIINAIFRGAGDAALAMRVLWIANLINILLNPLLIFGIGPFPKLGVLGSGIGTTIGRSTGVLIQLWFLFGGRSRVRLAARHFHVNLRSMTNLIRLSIGGIFQYLVGMASWIGMVRIVSIFGSDAVAGYTVAMRIFIFAILPSWGMSNAAATLVGQNLGAHRPDRAEQSVWRAGWYNMAFLGVVALLFVTFARPLVSIFTSDPAVIPFAIGALRMVSYGYVFYAWGMVIAQSFNGAGDTYTPTSISICTNWILQVPLAWFLAFKAKLGPNGVFAAIAISASIYAVVALLLFRRGKWKQRKI
ncbi:MAG TPA: MATE family efflux transporter [Bryobacteraceae bacterium]|nr:MATE family efflux transporter [Bryobacteraceae bacterium]